MKRQRRRESAIDRGPVGGRGSKSGKRPRTCSCWSGSSPRDLQAFEQLYRHYQPRLSRFLISIVNRPHVVEEVLDDTMMAVWNTAANFPGASKVSTWIFAIAYRQAVKARSRWDEPLPDLQDNDQVEHRSTAGRAASQQPQP